MSDRLTLDDCRRLQVSVPVYLTNEPGRSRQIMHMKMDGVGCEAEDGEGNKVGSVTGCVGGGMEITFVDTNETWYLSAADLFSAVYGAVLGDGEDGC